jgi:hypothetical protein
MRSALEALPTAKAAMTLHDVTVQSPTEPLIAAMGKTLDTGPTIKRIRLHQAGIGGYLIEDGLVYRST